MIPSKNKNNKLTIDPAARALFDSAAARAPRR